MWPMCGMARTCGYWERRARLQGIDIRTLDGLTRPFPVVAPGTVPVILLPAWAVGEVREFIIAWCLCEVSRATLGDDAVDARIAQAVAQLEAS